MNDFAQYVTIPKSAFCRLNVGDASQGALLRKWLEGQVLKAFEGQILPFDTAAARRCSVLHEPHRMADRDAMIAAIAKNHRHGRETVSGVGFPRARPAPLQATADQPAIALQASILLNV